MIQLEEFLEIEAAVKRDPTFIEACARRGITDMSLVCVDPWSAGNFGVEGEEGRHLSHAFCWVKSSPHDNLYAHPIEGLNPVVDIKTMEVIRVDDYGITPVPADRLQLRPRVRHEDPQPSAPDRHRAARRRELRRWKAGPSGGTTGRC